MTRVQVTKHALDGRPPYTYEARLLPSQTGWIVVEAEWPLHEVVAGPITFKPGDRLIEFFSTRDYFNAFLIHRQNGEFAGWYCNVTRPTTVDGDSIHWQDLYLDVLVDAEGTIHVEDGDELASSGLAESDPELYRSIVDAKDRLIEMIQRNEYPFSYES